MAGRRLHLLGCCLLKRTAGPTENERDLSLACLEQFHAETELPDSAIGNSSNTNRRLEGEKQASSRLQTLSQMHALLVNLTTPVGTFAEQSQLRAPFNHDLAAALAENTGSVTKFEEALLCFGEQRERRNHDVKDVVVSKVESFVTEFRGPHTAASNLAAAPRSVTDPPRLLHMPAQATELALKFVFINGWFQWN